MGDDLWDRDDRRVDESKSISVARLKILLGRNIPSLPLLNKVFNRSFEEDGDLNTFRLAIGVVGRYDLVRVELLFI